MIYGNQMQSVEFMKNLRSENYWVYLENVAVATLVHFPNKNCKH